MNEQETAALKTRFKRFVKITIDEKTLAFKPLSKEKIADLKNQIAKKPELSVQLSINACEFVCVHGKEHFATLADEYPLAFAGGGEDRPGVLDALLKMAHGDVSIEVA